MDSIGAIVAAIILAILLVGGGVVAQISFNESAEQELSFTETFDAGDIGTIVKFNESDQGNKVYYDDTVVVKTKNNKELVDNEDYEWMEDNGTLKVLSDDLANTVDNEINYSYRAPTDQQQHIGNRVSHFYTTAKWLPFVLIFLLVMIVVGGLGGLS
jgi:preprotein translocase subunit SecF